MSVGIPIGLLIGLITGAVTCIILRTVSDKDPTIAQAAKVTGELLALPAFWFGGPWLSTAVIKTVTLERFVSSYLITLSLVFAGITIVPIWNMRKS